jgi:4-diphosphocytidyl-2-C-methyl-D-erythritol kinase
VTGMRAKAPAKINWTLEVLGRRPDGYHEVRTVLQTIALWDELEFSPGQGLSLRCEGPHEAREDDLVLRAARCLGQEGGLSIVLRKRIPPGVGLGGGSSDAAATLRALRRLLSLPLSEAELLERAAGLGSDVPFFLHGGTALASGRGERVSPLPDAPRVWLVLVVPPLTLPGKTARMYGSLSPATYSDGSFTERFLERLGEQGLVDENYMHNAFEAVAYALFPDLALYRAALLRAGARRVHLAGSGPALFALATSEEEARAVHLRLELPAGQALVTHTVGRAEALEG